MKKITFICNKCGNEIKADELYQLSIEKIDGYDEEAIIDKSVHMIDFENENLADKHFCEKCLTNIVKSLPAEPGERPKIEAAAYAEIQSEVTDSGEHKRQELNISEDELRRLIVDEHLSIREIAEKYNSTYKRIWNLAIKWGIITKKDKKAKENGDEAEVNGDNESVSADEEPKPILHKNGKPVMTVESIKADYYDGKMTIPEIAKKYGVVVQSVITFMVKNHIGHHDKECSGYLKQQGRTSWEEK